MDHAETRSEAVGPFGDTHGPLARRARPLFMMQRVAAGVLILGIVILVAAEVFLRSAFLISLGFAHDISGYLFVGASFVGFAIASADGRLFRIEFLIKSAGPAVRQVLEFVFDVLALAFTLTIDWYLIKFVISSFTFGAREASTLGTPLFIPQLLMPLGATLLAITLLIRIADTLFIAFKAHSKG